MTTPELKDPGGGSSGESATQAANLLAIANDYYLFRTEEDVAYADVAIAGHRETHAILGLGFKRLLRHRFFVMEGGAPNSEALTTALRTLEARAVFEGAIHPVFTRIANVGNHLYIDLCDDGHHIVVVSAGRMGGRRFAA